jgi:O-antigen/teichoic acid export membrane protein
VFAVLVVLSPISTVLMSVLRGLDRTSEAVTARDLAGSLLPAMLFLGLYFFESAYLGIIVFWTARPIIQMIGYLYFTRNIFTLRSLFRPTVSVNNGKTLLTFSIPLALGGIIGTIMTSADTMMVGYFLNPSAVGLYNSVRPFHHALLVFIMSFEFLYLPIVTRFHREGAIKKIDAIYKNSTKWIVFLSFPAVLLLVLFPTDLLRLLFADEYTAAGTVLAILVVGSLTRMIVGLDGTTLQAIGQTQVNLYGSAAGIVANLLLNVVLIPIYGIEGAAIATVIGYMTHNIVEVTAIYRSINVHPFTADIIKPMIPTTILGVFLKIVVFESTLSPLLFVTVAVGFCTFHVISLVATRSFNENDLLLIDKVGTRLDIDVTPVRNFLEPYI